MECGIRFPNGKTIKAAESFLVWNFPKATLAFQQTVVIRSFIIKDLWCLPILTLCCLWLSYEGKWTYYTSNSSSLLLINFVTGSKIIYFFLRLSECHISVCSWLAINQNYLLQGTNIRNRWPKIILNNLSTDYSKKIKFYTCSSLRAFCHEYPAL